MSDVFDSMVLLDGDQAAIVAAVLEWFAAGLAAGSVASDTADLNDPALIGELADSIRRQLGG